MQYLFVGLLGLLRRWFQEPRISCALQHRRFLYTGLFTSNHMQFLLYLYICWMALWNLINQLFILFFDSYKFPFTGFSRWLWCWVYTSTPIWILWELYEPKCTSRILPHWYNQWHCISGLFLDISSSLLCQITYSWACPLHMYAPKPVDMIQDHMAHGSHGMFTQAGYNDPSQDESSQMHYGMASAGPLQSQVGCLPVSASSVSFITWKLAAITIIALLQNMMNPLYSQSYAHYNTQPPQW